MMDFNTLYKKNTNGSIQCWSVVVNENLIITEFGRMDGKLQITNDLIKSGKNLGKKNETNPDEQAQLKAQQMFDKKLKNGYTANLVLAQSTDNVLDGVVPMLAFPIEKKEKHVVYPAIAQPKLDGMRCIAVITNGVCQLYSRTQKEINSLPHLKAELEQLFYSETITLDGELYSHEHKENFNRIMSLIKRDDVHPDCEEIQYHVYDVVGEGGYLERTAKLQKALMGSDFVKYLEHEVVHNREDLDRAFHLFLELGFEGAMYRNPSISYENKRSASLLKVKVFDDSEFKIIGVQEGNGKLQGHAGSFICETPSGQEFKAKMKGELGALIEYFVNFEKYKGKFLTVQFQGFTPAGIPRFPVGLRIRGEE